MSAFSLSFEAGVAALMIALIVYCVRLDRRLCALRENDSAIRDLIGQLHAASDRAEAAAGVLKAAGLDAERSLNQAIRTAQAVEDDLIRRGRAPAAPAPAPTPSVASAVPGATARRAPAPSRAAAPPQIRSRAERDLLRAIRFARTEGQG